MDRISGHSVQFKIEVEDRPLSILLVLDRISDVVLLPWEDAFLLAETMRQVLNDLKDLPHVVDASVVVKESGQVKLNTRRGCVAICVSHTDRVKFTTRESFIAVMQALRLCAQDAELSTRGIFLPKKKKS